MTALIDGSNLVRFRDLEQGFKRRIRQKYGGRCLYCGRSPSELLEMGRSLTEAKITCDHIRPRSKGGTEDESNQAPACGHCNIRKENKNVWQWWLISGNFDLERAQILIEIMLGDR